MLKVHLGLTAMCAIAPTAALIAASPASAERCTNIIDYTGDPRSNAEINGIGASTGSCPAPLGAGPSSSVPGLTTGVSTGQPCSNIQTYIFGISATGQPMACGHALNGGGVWGPALSVVGVRQPGAACSDTSVMAQSADGRPMVCGGGRWTINAA